MRHKNILIAIAILLVVDSNHKIYSQCYITLGGGLNLDTAYGTTCSVNTSYSPPACEGVCAEWWVIDSETCQGGAVKGFVTCESEDRNPYRELRKGQCTGIAILATPPDSLPYYQCFLPCVNYEVVETETAGEQISRANVGADCGCPELHAQFKWEPKEIVIAKLQVL